MLIRSSRDDLAGGLFISSDIGIRQHCVSGFLNEKPLMAMANIFDILGPIMRGFSSSHTAGAVRMGAYFRRLHGGLPSKITITLYGSYAKTAESHGTLNGLAAGLLGMTADDKNLPNAWTLLKRRCSIDLKYSEEDAGHPNAALLQSTEHTVLFHSVGGGLVRVIKKDGKEVNQLLRDFNSGEGFRSFAEIKDIDAAIQTEIKRLGLDSKTFWELIKKRWVIMKEGIKTYHGALSNEIATLTFNAIKKLKANNAWKPIVAAPTAGSCGVLPSALQLAKNPIKALVVAGLVGEIIANRASVAGADLGCQAEVGASSAMAAAALAYDHSADMEKAESAASIALSSFLGLVCDPVGGFVVIPCAFRNMAGALTAAGSAEIALTGYKFPIPFDEVVDAMKEIGRSMPPALKETAEGGLAATPTGRRLRCRRRLAMDLPD